MPIDPEQHERGRRRHARPVAPGERHDQRRRRARASAGDDDASQNICGCSRRVPTSRSAPRATARERRQRALEQALAVEAVASSGACCEARRCLMRCAARGSRRCRRPSRPGSSRSGALKPCQTARLYVGQRAADHRPRRRGERRADRPAPATMPTTRQASTSSSTGTRIQRTGSCGWRGRSRRRRAEEDVVAEAQRVDDREDAGERRRQRQADLDPRVRREEHRLGEEHLLRQEAVQQRHAGHRRAGHDAPACR